jgi:thiamine biosynthesis lipoprotein
MQVHATSFHAMGTPCELRLAVPSPGQAADLARAAIAEVARLEARYSRYREDSDLSAINRVAAAGGGIEVDDETAALLDYADACHRESGGLFDISSGILRRAWRFDAGQLPDEAQVQQLLQHVGWHRVDWPRRDGPVTDGPLAGADATHAPAPDTAAAVTPATNTPTADGHRAGGPETVAEAPPGSTRRLRFTVPGMELDFGGIVKEYAVDRVAALLHDAGVAHGFVNLGGDVRALGPQPDGSPWRIGIRHPRAPGALLITLELATGALASSGDYERCIVVDGRRYGHILDPRTGWPVRRMAAVSVVAPMCVVAGSAATIGMLRDEAGPEWLRSLGLPCLWMDVDGQCGGSLAPPPVA